MLKSLKVKYAWFTMLNYFKIILIITYFKKDTKRKTFISLITSGLNHRINEKMIDILFTLLEINRIIK
jgi:hypothetical protein